MKSKSSFDRADKIVGKCLEHKIPGETLIVVAECITEVIAAEIEEAVKESWSDPPPWFIRSEDADRLIAQAYEECARIAENRYGTRFHDKTAVRTGKKIAADLRAKAKEIK